MTVLNSPSIRHGEFVKLTVDGTVYTFCSSAGDITINGTTFSGYGSFIQVSAVQRNIKSTSDDLVVGISGLDPNNISLILSFTS